MRYGEEVLAARGDMARAAAEQGRDAEQHVAWLSDIVGFPPFQA
jgi:hypothetical protein